MSVIRYRLSESEMEVDDDGDFVDYQDYAKLEAERDRLREALIEVLECYNNIGELSDVVWDDARAALQEDRDGHTNTD